MLLGTVHWKATNVYMPAALHMLMVPAFALKVVRI